MAPLSLFDDPKALAREQYRDSYKLQERIDLHQLYSTNQYGWFRWVFDQFDLPPECRILELGGGPGDLWLKNLERIPAGWAVALSDFSAGMVRQAREYLGDCDSRFSFTVLDAQSIPFEAEGFDAVIANHMLYHVPERAQALAQIRRVLKPQGCLYATTIGTGHMRELRELVARFDPGLAANEPRLVVEFTLENGGAQISPWFSDVALRRYEDSLLVTEAKPLVDYFLSSTWIGVTADQRDGFTRFVELELERNDDAIYVGKDSGMFLAQDR